MPVADTDEDLASRMPVYAYEIDDNDIPPYAAAGPGVVAAGASHVGAWFLNPVTPALDANQQVLQNQEIQYVTALHAPGTHRRPPAPRRGHDSTRRTSQRRSHYNRPGTQSR